MVLVALAVLCGAALQSATGFGFSLLAAPLLFAALDPQRAVGLMVALGLVINVMTLGTERRRPQPLVRDAAAILAGAIPGALLGVVVLRSLDAIALQLLVSAGVIGALAARRWAPRAPREPAPARSWAAPLAGLLAGGLGTATTTSGPPLLLYLLGRGAHPAVVRDTLSLCFLGLGLIAPAALLVTQTSGALPDPLLVAIGVPAVIAGHLVGRYGFARLQRGGYETVVTALLLASVATGLAGTLG
jgi:uncharacterized membrane protein YfcA